MHTVYGGANLFKADTCVRMGEIALRNLHTYAPNFVELARALRLPGHEQLPTLESDVATLTARLDALPANARRQEPAWLAYTVYAKMVQKLEREAVEDFRIDFEDGFGNRPDAEEDATAVQAAQEVAKGMAQGTLSPFIGIRIKPFTEDLKARGVRTLDIFLTTLLAETGGRLPDNFVVMLPKVTIPEQMTTLVRLFELLEKANGLAPAPSKWKRWWKPPRLSWTRRGATRCCALSGPGRGAAWRPTSAPTTTPPRPASRALPDDGAPGLRLCPPYDQGGARRHRHFLSDGATNVMPIGPHRGDNLSFAQLRENQESVHNAWRQAYHHTTHSLINGFYQGWDLNPAQLPMRYAATYQFFLSSYVEAVHRLRVFVERAAISTLTGDIFDDAALARACSISSLRPSTVVPSPRTTS